METKFDMNFANDAELEQTLDKIIANIGGRIAVEENKRTVSNELRLRQMEFTYAALKYITKDEDVQISYKLYEPFQTMGSITIEGETFEFDDTEWFARVSEFASNIEVYPLTSGKVRMTFTFHGIRTPIE